MKLYKVSDWNVRQVEGGPCPGMDSEGDVCYENTHYVSEVDALSKLEDNAKALLNMSVRAVFSARASLALAEKDCVDAALLVDRLSQ